MQMIMDHPRTKRRRRRRRVRTAYTKVWGCLICLAALLAQALVGQVELFGVTISTLFIGVTLILYPKDVFRLEE